MSIMRHPMKTPGSPPSYAMCFEPVSAFFATYGTIISTVSTAVGTLVSVAGALSGGQAANSAAQYNAQVAQNNAMIAQQNAQIAADQAAADAKRQRLQAIKDKGKIRAGYGASGVTVEGSPMDVLEESAVNAELDALITEYNGGLRVRAYQNQAAAELNTANLELMRGEAALSSSYMTAAGELFGGAATIGSRITPTTTPKTSGSAMTGWTSNTSALATGGYLDSL